MRRRLTVAVALAALVAFVLPVQTYLGNPDIFPYSLLRLLPELVGLFAIFALGLCGLTVLLAKVRLADVFASFLTAAIVCLYLETGLLSMGLPELNGGFVPELSNVARIIADGVVWLAIILVFVVLTRFLKSYLHWIALAVLVLALAAVIDARRPSSVAQDPASTPSTGRFVPQPTVVANVRYSSERNILVFVIDSMPGKFIADLVRDNRTLLEKFPGFTAYPRNIGMHECTKRGVPGLVTGHHYDDKEISEGEYPMTMFGTNSVIIASAAAGWSVAYSPDLLPYGYTNLPIEQWVRRVEKRRSRDAFAFLRQSTEVPNLSLFDTVAFRLSPFCFKGPILYGRIRHAVKGRHSNDAFWSERGLYPSLAGRPVATDGKPFLGSFHSWGVHPPWETDLKTEAIRSLTQLGGLMDAYRASGLYDRSLIIITADHGLALGESVDGFPPPASALLWVKPEGAKAPYAESDLKTSHAQIAPLIRAALSKPLSAAECAEILHCEDRIFRSVDREGYRDCLHEWRDKPNR